jgi:hypothetical protein
MKSPNLISLDLQEKKYGVTKIKETVSPTSSLKNTENHNINPSTNQIFKYKNLLNSNNNLKNNSNKLVNNLFKYSASSNRKLNNNNGTHNNNKNFFYFNNLNNNNFVNVNNQKNENLPLISNFNCSKEPNEIGYLKNIRNDELKLRKLINKRKQNRLESINNHHYETLRENFKKSSNGLYLTSLLDQKANGNLHKDNSLNFPKNENLFQNNVNNSNHERTNEEDFESKSNYKLIEAHDNNAFSENLNENNKDTDEKIYVENIHLGNINKLFSNEAITKNLISDKNINKIEENKRVNDYFKQNQDSSEEIIVIKKNSIKELRKINHYFVSKIFKKKKLSLLNNSFSYKDINEEYKSVTIRESEKLCLENLDLDLVSKLSKEESSIHKNKLIKMRNSMLFQQLQLSEKEILPLAFLKNNNANETVEKNIITMKFAKKHYLEEQDYYSYLNNSNNKNNNEMNINSCENLDENFNNKINKNENENLKSSKIEKIEKLRNQKKRLLSQILNNSDDDDNINFELKNIKSKENRRLLRPSLTLFKNTLYQMKNEINYSKDLNEYEKGLSPYEKLLVKINFLFKSKFEDKGKFINKIKETFMIENQLKIKHEHTKQIDEFYETKLGSLKDSIKSIKNAEKLFAIDFLNKFYDYLKHVNSVNEMEKQNLKKAKQNKNELDIDLIKLNSNIQKIKDKLAVYTEYRNFMICVKERRIEPPAFFSHISHSQVQLTKRASNNLRAVENRIKAKRIEIAKLEVVLKAEIDKKNNKTIVNKITIPKASCAKLNLNSENSSFKNIHINNAASNNLKANFQIKDQNDNNFNESSKMVITKNANNESSADLETNIFNDNNTISSKKLNSSDKAISKNSPNYERIMLENKLAEEHSYLDSQLKEKEEYARYYNYLTEPIFKTFDEFYTELKKLERDNITLLNKMNENSTILYRTKMELYQTKAEDERTVKKFKSDIINTQAEANEARSQKKVLKLKLNRFIIAMRKQSNPQNKNKSKGIAIKNLSDSTNTNFPTANPNTENNNLINRFKVNPLSKTIIGNFSEVGHNGIYDLESVESARNSKKPGYFSRIINTFNLVNEIIKFEKVEMLKALTFEEQALMMLQHIENNINLLLYRHENYKKNPQTKNKLIAVTNTIDKENRAKKCDERMKQVLENQKRMIERVNYKFYRLNVLPKRKCAPRFRPKDSVNAGGLYNSVNFIKNNIKDEHDFLDII